MPKEIIVDYMPGGIAKMEGVGFVGKECVTEMESLKRAIGKEVKFEPKPELRQKVTAGGTTIKA